MIDLHIHTNYSDGTDNVIDILKKAEKIGLEAISITDHDTIGAYSELNKINIPQYYNGLVIPGIEIKTTFNRITIDILGYDIDIERLKKSSCVNISRRIDIQNKYLKNFIRVGNELGIKCDNNIEIKNIRDYAAVTYYKEISKYIENYDIIPELLKDKEEKFYWNTSGNKKSPFYIDESEDSLDINFVIDEIHRCGGKAFLAHLFEYKVDNHLEFVTKILEETKIDGIECYYSTFSKAQSKLLFDISNKYKKYISGGTDYHGETKININLGIGQGNLNVSFDIIQDWVRKH